MDFSSLEKWQIKTGDSYLLCREKKSHPWTLSHISLNPTNENNFGLYAQTLRNTLSKGTKAEVNSFYFDGKDLDLIQYTTPPVGYFNSSKGSYASVLTRYPSRQYRVGFTPNNARLEAIPSGTMSTNFFGDLALDDYEQIVANKYPDFDSIVSMIRKGHASVAINRSTVLFKNNLGLLVMSMGGYPVCWFFNGKVQPIKNTPMRIVEKCSKVNINELSEALKNAQ